MKAVVLALHLTEDKKSFSKGQNGVFIMPS